jgi:hypothetical protein
MTSDSVRLDGISHLHLSCDPRGMNVGQGSIQQSKRPANASGGKERETTAPHKNGKQLEPNGAAGNSTRS